MVAYNFHQVLSNGARDEAGAGRWKLAALANERAPEFQREEPVSAEHVALQRLVAGTDPSAGRLLTAVYVSLKTYPLVVLTGRAGAGKAALAQHLATALAGDAPGQMVRISSARWAAQSGQRDYYRNLHTRFGDSQLSEVLSEAASPAGRGKLYFVLFDGLAPDELTHYVRDRLQLVPRAPKLAVLPSNLLVLVTLHQPFQISALDAQILAHIPQIDVTLYRQAPGRLPPPPVGAQRAFIRDAVRDVVTARDRLRSLFGVYLPQLSPSPRIVSVLRWYGLSIPTTLDSDMWLFLANSFNAAGQGMFASDARVNLQIAYDVRLTQRIMAQLDQSRAALRPELARAVGC